MPVSMTVRTPGTVIDVSATFVLSTMRRPRWGWKMRCCSLDDSRAYSGRTSVSWSWRRRRKSAVSWISRSPDRNTSVSPIAGELVDGVADRLHLVAVSFVPSGWSPNGR